MIDDFKLKNWERKVLRTYIFSVNISVSEGTVAVIYGETNQLLRPTSSTFTVPPKTRYKLWAYEPSTVRIS